MSVAPANWLFVCSGNICRTPMAHGIAEALIAKHQLPIQVRSAGTLGIMGREADPHATAVCAEKYIDISGHRSQGVTPLLLEWSDRIFVMETTHAQQLRVLDPRCDDKLVLLGAYVGLIEIEDPIGGWRIQFRRCRDLIEDSVVAAIQAELAPRA